MSMIVNFEKMLIVDTVLYDLKQKLTESQIIERIEKEALCYTEHTREWCRGLIGRIVDCDGTEYGILDALAHCVFEKEE